MTSRGIGDVRRVLKQEQSWIELTFHPPQPEFPDDRGDRLLRFLFHQVSSWEGQVAIEANEYRDRPLGPALTRYAQDIRKQCSAVRRVIARYAAARDSGAPEADALRDVLADLATRYSGHPDWRETWPLD